MFCQECGSKNEDGSVFCQECGTRLVVVQETQKIPKVKEADTPKAEPPKAPEAPKAPKNDTPEKQPSAPKEQKPEPKPVAQPEPQPAPQPAAQPKPEPAAQPAPQPAQTAQAPEAAQSTQSAQPVQAQQVVYGQKGCIGTAWEDIKLTPGWFKHVLFLGLMNFIPGLSTGVTGYCLKWGDSAARGERLTLPKRIFDNKAFLTGLIELATWLIYGVVCGVALWIAAGILSFIPFIILLLPLLMFVASLFIDSIKALASMRGTVMYDLGRAFDIKEITKTRQGSMGSMFGCYIIPKLICGLIVGAVVGLLIIIALIIFSGSMLSVINSFSAMSSSSSSYGAFGQMNAFGNFIGALFTLIAQLGVSFIIILLIGMFVAAWLGALEKLLRYRALGYWVARYMSEWTTEEYKEKMRC